jgi:Holliday junction DNA helicase RuvB
LANDFDELLKLAGLNPDQSEEQAAAKEIMKVNDGLAKFMINPARSVDEVMSEADADHALRPRSLDEVVGQSHIKAPLTVAMRAARRRNAPLGHVILFGPPGLGKTTVASIIAREQETLLIMDTGPQLSQQKITYYCGEIIKAFNDDEQHVTFFVDEAQKIPAEAITMLLPLLEDFRFLNSLHTPPFTFVAATTDPGHLPDAFIQRFAYQYNVNYYTPDEIGTIVTRNVAKVWGLDPGKIDEEKATDDELAAHNDAVGKHNAFLADAAVQASINTISQRSRGVPRTANRLIKHVHDYALGYSEDEPEEDATPDLKPEIVTMAMQAHGVDRLGLTIADRNILVAMAERFRGRAVGIDAIAAAVGENAQTIKLVIEPYLVRSGLVNRTLRGRELTDAGKLIAALTLAGGIEY